MAWLNDTTDFLGLTDYGGSTNAMNAAIAAMGSVPMPTLDALQLNELVSAGTITPEQAQAYSLEQSKMNDVYADPRLLAAQKAALANLQEVGANGMTAVDRAKLQQIQAQEDSQLRGQREALAQNAAARGVGGSGLELMNQQMAAQESANRMGQRDTEVAAQAQQARMAALQQAGQLAGQMSSQDWQQQAAKAQAADAINQFNTQNKQQVSMQNIAARNQAQAANLAEAQRLRDTNTQIANQAAQYNAGRSQQMFQNQLGKAQGMAGAYGNMANLKMAQSQAAMNSLAGGAQAGALMYMASDVNSKENIKKADFDVDDFLNSITGYKFTYKDPAKNGEGERLGVMAQDMEKSPMGSEAVVDGPDGKQIDMKKALSASLAALGRLNERLNNVEGK